MHTSGEKEFLLKFARQSLEKYLHDGEKNEAKTANQKLCEKRGVFVTLYKNGRLRGCIGNIEPVETIIISVRDNALAAAKDPRFEPLDLNELSEVKIEISILTEPEKTTLDEIKEGDGVVIQSELNRATYLPQVWKELIDRDEFFGSLCQKAGLDWQCYKNDDVEFFKYQAEVFREKRL